MPVDSKRIETVLQNIEDVTGAGAVYHGLHDRSMLTNAGVCSFCRFCLDHPTTRAFCRYACCDATLHALSSGEPYFYRCWAGLLFATVAIAPGKQCGGGISLGGFATADSTRDICEALEQRLAPLRRTDIDAFTRHINSIRAISPNALRGLGMYALEATFSSGLNSPSFFQRQNRKYNQQREIAEAQADLRIHDSQPPDIPGDAYQLLAYLERDDRESAMRHLSGYLARLLLVSNWDLNKLRAHLRVLLAVMSSHEILEGLSSAAATNRELRCLMRLEAASTTEDCCYEVAEFIGEHFGDRRYDDTAEGTLAERTETWLEHHVGEPCTLTAAARALGVSESTLVHRVKKEKGHTFRQLRREVRLAEARRLLATTEIEISEIAAVCGFSDQSHLTKCLKSATSLTPRQFRQLLHPSKDDVLA